MRQCARRNTCHRRKGRARWQPGKRVVRTVRITSPTVRASRLRRTQFNSQLVTPISRMAPLMRKMVFSMGWLLRASTPLLTITGWAAPITESTRTRPGWQPGVSICGLKYAAIRPPVAHRYTGGHIFRRSNWRRKNPSIAPRFLIIHLLTTKTQRRIFFIPGIFQRSDGYLHCH